MNLAALFLPLIPLCMMASCVWVYFDAQAIGGAQAHMPGVFGTTPAMWAISCFLLWAWFFPTYVLQRNELKRRVAEYRSLPDELKWDRK
jgi:hypothetical protein